MNVRTICLVIVLFSCLNLFAQEPQVPLPPAVVGSPYAHQIAISDNKPDLVFATDPGQFPSWLHLTREGRLYGLPGTDAAREKSAFAIVIRHGDNGSIYARAMFSLIVYAKLCEDRQEICHQLEGISCTSDFVTNGDGPKKL